MARRILRHREERPPAWGTVERATGAGAAVMEADTDVVVLDCVTLLVSNAMTGVEDGSEEGCKTAARREVDGILDALGSRDGTLVAVTNEVGLGLVPSTPLGRWFRDAQGRANQRLAGAAERVVMMVSGIPVELRSRTQ